MENGIKYCDIAKKRIFGCISFASPLQFHLQVLCRNSNVLNLQTTYIQYNNTKSLCKFVCKSFAVVLQKSHSRKNSKHQVINKLSQFHLQFICNFICNSFARTRISITKLHIQPSDLEFELTPLTDQVTDSNDNPD